MSSMNSIITEMSNLSISTSPLLDFLQDRITGKLLLDPVVLNCCGSRLNHYNAVRLYGNLVDGETSITEQKCTICMGAMTGYFREMRLRRLVELICGLINMCSIQDLAALLNDYLARPSLLASSTDNLLVELNSLINEISLTTLQNEKLFKRQLCASCRVLTAEEIKDLNPTKPLILRKGIVLIPNLPNLFVDTQYDSAQENIRSMFNRIFLLKGKTVAIASNSESECSLELTQLDQNLTFVSIRSDQEMLLTLENGNLTTSIQDLYNQMIKANSFTFTVKSEQSLTLTNIDSGACQNILKDISSYKIRLTKFLQRLTDTHWFSWNLENSSFIIKSNEDFTELTLTPSQGFTIECYRQDIQPLHFTAASFVAFLKNKGNEFTLTGPKRLVFTFEKPVTEFFEGTTYTNHVINNIFEYLAPLAGKEFKDFFIPHSISGLAPLEVKISGDNSITILFTGIASFSFCDVLRISDQFYTLVAQMQREHIQTLTLEPGSFLLVTVLPSDMEILDKLSLADLIAPQKCTVDEDKCEIRASQRIDEETILFEIEKFCITIQSVPNVLVQPALILSDGTVSKRLRSQALSEEASSNGASSSEVSSMTVTTTESTVGESSTINS